MASRFITPADLVALATRGDPPGTTDDDAMALNAIPVVGGRIVVQGSLTVSDEGAGTAHAELFYTINGGSSWVGFAAVHGSGTESGPWTVQIGNAVISGVGVRARARNTSAIHSATASITSWTLETRAPSGIMAA